MNPEFKGKWVKALRSGKYKQTKETLKDDTGFCCLGVLLDVSKMGEYEGANYVLLDPDDDNNEIVCDGELDGARGLFGITSSQESHLIHMNDDEGKTFAEIADHIEANL